VNPTQGGHLAAKFVLRRLDRQVPLQPGRHLRPGDRDQRGPTRARRAAIKGIESVKRNAPNAEIDDQTDK
jgi:hypothetical protein